MKYASDDGKLFESEQRCLEYERRLKVVKEEEKKLAEEKHRRFNEMITKAMELKNYIDNYNKDYIGTYNMRTIIPYTESNSFIYI